MTVAVSGRLDDRIALTGALKPIIDRTFSLEAIADAQRYMESNQQKGKIVVTVKERE